MRTTDAPTVWSVCDAEDLGRLVAKLRAAGEFALDTEFIPENRLVPELGLIQVAAEGVEAVVDPLAVKDLGPLYALVADAGILKVVHSGKHDFDLFHNLAGVTPRNIFDTQVAAAVIGHGKRMQIALRALVAGFMNRELSKQQQMSDWLKRPLSPRQIEYAISDVRYLLPLRDKLTAQARRLGRLQWLKEEMKALTDATAYGLPPVEEAYHPLDGAGLSALQRGALKELAAWRETKARKANLPRGWIMKDGVLRDLARRQPRNRGQLMAPYERAGGRPPKGDPRTLQQTRTILTKNAATILKLVAAGAKRPVPWDGPPKHRRRGAAESLSLLLETWLKLRAAQHEVAPELLATQEELRAVSAAYPGEAEGVRTLSGFRREVLGEDLLLILSGKAVIQVGAGDAEGGMPPIRLARLGRLGRFMLRDSGSGNSRGK